MRVVLDGGDPTWGAAHVVARREWLRGDLAMVMNAQFYGAFDIAPRSHPNDGKVDVLRVNAEMGWRERLQARQRARTGSHLPHRDLTMRSVADCDVQFDQPMVVWIDGVRYGTAQHLQVIVEPDAYAIYV
jgi:diacylglycerol kinase family enzyme